MLLCGCIDDKSTDLYPENNPNFSFITIESPTDTISVDLGKMLFFKPNVKQKFEQELSYRWTYNKITDNGGLGKELECGNELELKYTFLKQGEYKLKLEVKNKDYSEVKSWIMQVRTYDSGYFVIGNDDSGASTLSFARELSPQDILDGKQLEFTIGLVNNINPNYKINNVIKIIKSIKNYGSSDANLHIFSKDKIYIADPTTFEIFAVTDFKAEYKDETIIDVAISDTYVPSAYILTSKNRLVQYNKNEFGVFEAADNNLSSFQGDFYINMFYTAGTNYNDSYFWVDKKSSKIFTIINYFEYFGGRNPANNILIKKNGAFVEDKSVNPFIDYNILGLFRMNGELFSGQNTNLFAVSSKKEDKDSYKIVEYKVDYQNAFKSVETIEFRQEGATWKEGIKFVPNGRYNSVYYANASKVYVWYPKNVSPYNKFPADYALDLGVGKEITFMRVSYDMRQLYVGFYDTKSPETFKGGFYIYDASKIGLIKDIKPQKKFENISSKPVDIVYKTLKHDEYNSKD